MRLLSFSTDAGESWGAVVGGEVVDLGRRLPQYSALADFLGSEDFKRRDELAAAAGPSLQLAEIDFLPVIPRPEKIICAVRNYLDHHHEAVATGLKREITEFPPIFLRVWRSQVGHNAPVVRPKVSDHLDWEGELAVVIGKGGRHIAEDRALDQVAGYSIFNDVSVRDWQAPCAADCVG